MSSRAEKLLSRAWHLAGNVRTEAFLEEALAAALEHPDFYERLMSKLRWKVPAHQPRILTQRWVEGGRTDITFDWQDGSSIVLELKAGAPPSVKQIRQYLDPNVRVAAIAKFTGRLHADPSGDGFLGVLTWRHIRDIDWPDAPLVIRQLHQLLDTTEVAMPRITLPALTGILASWDTRDVLDRWSSSAVDAALPIFREAGLHCVRKEKKRERIKVDTNYRRLVHWFWPPPWRADSFGLFAGMFMGRAGADVIFEGVPDMILAVHVDPAQPLGRCVRQDAGFLGAIERWKGRDGSVLREYSPADSTWEILRARESSVDMIRANDGGSALIQWVESCAKEWVSDGIIQRLATLESETRTVTGEASELPGESDDSADS